MLGGIVTASVGPSSAIILDPIGRDFIPAAQLASMRSSLSGGLEWVFAILAIDAAVVAVVALRFMPAVRIERRGQVAAPPRVEQLAASEPIGGTPTPQPSSLPRG